METIIKYDLRSKEDVGPNVGGDVGSKEIETVLIFSEDYWESKEEQEAASQKRLAEMPSLEEMLKEVGLEGFHEPESI